MVSIDPSLSLQHGKILLVPLSHYSSLKRSVSHFLEHIPTLSCRLQLNCHIVGILVIAFVLLGLVVDQRLD
jgi:hypothetical protein